MKSYSEIIYSNFEPIAFKTIRNAGYNTDGNYPKGSKENAEKLRIELENKLQQAMDSDSMDSAPGLRKRRIPNIIPKPGAASGLGIFDNLMAALKGAGNAAKAGDELSALKGLKGADNAGAAAQGVDNVRPPAGRPQEPAGRPPTPDGHNPPPPNGLKPPGGANANDVIGAGGKFAAAQTLGKTILTKLALWVKNILIGTGFVVLLFFMMSPSPDTSTPDSQGMQPGTQGMQPGTQGMQPGTQGMQPGTEGLDPSYSDVDGGYGNYEDLGASNSDQLWPENDNLYGGSDNYEFSENGGSSGLESPALDPSLDPSNIDQNVSPQDGIQVDSTTGSDTTTGIDYSSMYPDIIDDVNNYTWTFDPVAMKYFRLDENSEKVYYE
jgi:hypothetical protein